jgi:hypothetical protein
MRDAAGSAIIALIAVLAPLSLAAQERWTPVVTSMGSADLDLQSVTEVTNGQFRVWLRYTLNGALSRMVQDEYDCVGRRSRMLRFLGYYGEAIARQNFDYTSTAEWRSVVPSSSGETELQSVCEAIQRGRSRPAPSPQARPE